MIIKQYLVFALIIGNTYYVYSRVNGHPTIYTSLASIYLSYHIVVKCDFDSDGTICFLLTTIGDMIWNFKPSRGDN